MYKRLSLLILLLAFATPSFAVPEVTANQPANQKIPFTVKDVGSGLILWRAEPDELIATDKPIHIKLDYVPVKLEMRAVFQGAVGEDGPWMDVPGITKMQEWSSLPAKREFDVKIENDGREPKISWPEKLDCSKSEFLSKPEECTRWTNIYKKCTSGSGYNPCYVYQSEIQIRFWREGESTPESLTISFPGGC